MELIRPGHLPDFQAPPLSEVVLGVQFSPPHNYQQILAGEVWKLFRDDYPRVEELQGLVPTFETFGLPILANQLKLISGAPPNRFWFLNTGGEELIQFQHDRLLHNWRKVGDGANKYPRFEHMVDHFRDELVKVESFAASLTPQSLQITQCEITYINQIRTAPAEELVVSDWLNSLSFQDPVRADDFALTFRQVIKDDNGRPFGRLVVEAATANEEDGSPLIVLNITVRGAPEQASLESAIDFICKGRELIVLRFAQMTTDAAHKHWGRLS